MTSYHIRAIWDPEAEVYYSESNVPGLVVEAATLPEFMAIAEELLPEMLEANLGSGTKRQERPSSVDIAFAV